MAFLNRLWAIYLLSFVIECLSLLWSPARDASLPNIVPRRQLANANSLVLVSAYATLPIGGAAFAVLVGVSKSLSARIPILASQPESLALVFDAATFVFSPRLLRAAALLGCGGFPPGAFCLCCGGGDRRRHQFAGLFLFAAATLLGLGIRIDELELGRRPGGEPESSVCGERSSPTEAEPPIPLGNPVSRARIADSE